MPGDSLGHMDREPKALSPALKKIVRMNSRLQQGGEVFSRNIKENLTLRQIENSFVRAAWRLINESHLRMRIPASTLLDYMSLLLAEKELEGTKYKALFQEVHRELTKKYKGKESSLS